MRDDFVYNSISKLWDFAQKLIKDAGQLVNAVLNFLFTPCSELLAEIDFLPAAVRSLLSRILPDITVIQMILTAGVTFFLVYTLIKWFAGIITG